MQRNTLVALASFALSAPTFSQSIQSVSPPAASPGTEVLIEGSGLDALTFVQFRFQDSIQSSTSGSSISYVNEVAPTIESAERIRVVVPDIPNSSSFPAYDFVGTIRGLTPTGATASVPFGYLEIANGNLAISRQRFVNFGATTVESNGEAALPASIPSAGLIGVDAAFQWYIFDPAASNQGIAVAQGLKIRI